jgi:hypothetical protein
MGKYTGWFKTPGTTAPDWFTQGPMTGVLVCQKITNTSVACVGWVITLGKKSLIDQNL